MVRVHPPTCPCVEVERQSLAEPVPFEQVLTDLSEALIALDDSRQSLTEIPWRF